MAVGHLDTLLDYENPTDDHAISVAPGEGNYPISIFIVKQSEVLAFPTLYCGQAKVLARKMFPMPQNVNLSFAEKIEE